MKASYKKVTANLPDELLNEAIQITKKGITLTLIEGLEELRNRQRRARLRKLRGRIGFHLNLEKTRR